MRKVEKLTIVGGGSAYIPGVAKAILANIDVFDGATIALYDIDEENLMLIARLFQKMANATGANLTVTAEVNMDAAFDGADFVLTSFRAGGFEMRLLDERIPLEYGVMGHETVGPGGFMYALRTIHAIRPMIDSIERHCPQAWVLNYTNPTNIVTQAVASISDINLIGICDQFDHDRAVFASLIGVEPAKVRMRALGLNHANWAVEFVVEGEDRLPEVIQAARKAMMDGLDDSEDSLMIELAARAGLIPSKYNQFYYFRKRTVERTKRAGKVRTEEILDELPGIFEHLRTEADKQIPNVTKHRGSADFGDFAVDIIAALTGRNEFEAPLNVPNKGYITNLEDGLIVEVPAKISKDSIEPIAMGTIPQRFAGLLGQLAEYQTLAAHTALYGTYDDAVWALCSNPLIAELDLAESLYNHLSSMQKEFLPERLLGR